LAYGHQRPSAAINPPTLNLDNDFPLLGSGLGKRRPSSPFSNQRGIDQQEILPNPGIPKTFPGTGVWGGSQPVVKPIDIDGPTMRRPSISLPPDMISNPKPNSGRGGRGRGRA